MIEVGICLNVRVRVIIDYRSSLALLEEKIWRREMH